MQTPNSRIHRHDPYLKSDDPKYPIFKIPDPKYRISVFWSKILHKNTVLSAISPCYAFSSAISTMMRQFACHIQRVMRQFVLRIKSNAANEREQQTYNFF